MLRGLPQACRGIGFPKTTVRGMRARTIAAYQHFQISSAIRHGHAHAVPVAFAFRQSRGRGLLCQNQRQDRFLVQWLSLHRNQPTGRDVQRHGPYCECQPCFSIITHGFFFHSAFPFPILFMISPTP